MKIKSKFFKFLLAGLIILSGLNLSAAASSISAGLQDKRCEELQKIIDNSGNGFGNVRFDEKTTGSNSYIYNTNLQFSGFKKTAILISDIPLYNGEMVKTAFYQAFMVESELNMAKTLYFAALVDLRSCLPNAPMNNTTPPGYVSYNKFSVKDKINNSEVTISLALLKKAENSYYLTINVVSDKSTAAAGTNHPPNPPSSNLSDTAKTPPISCNDLSNIFTQSYNGYLNVRYNERLNSLNYYVYNTTLPNAGFQKTQVQITKASLFHGGTINAAHYQAFSVFATFEDAARQMNLVKDSMKICASQALFDNKKPAGFLEFDKYLISVKPSNSEITVSLVMLKGSDSQYYVSLQVVSNLANTETGVMKNPPTTSGNNSTSSQSVIPSKTQDMCEILKILTIAAKNNFENLKNEEIPKKSGSYDSYEDAYEITKKYRAKISYSNFENPQIQQSIYHDKMNYYVSKMIFQNEAGFSYMFKALEDRIKGCTNLSLVKDWASQDLYTYKLANQNHADGFKYDYYIQISRQEGYVENPRLIFKFVLSKK